MFKLKGCAINICLLAMLLCGCGQTGQPRTVDESALTVNKEGGITEYLIDSFDKDYYAISEVQDMAAQEAARYNSGKPSGEKAPVRLEKVEILENSTDKALIQYSYDNADTYRDFKMNICRQDKLLFFGTAAEAGEYLNDMDPQMQFIGVKKKDSIDMSGVSAMKEKHVIITDVSSVIYCPYAVTYISDGLVMREDGGVDTSQAADSKAVIVMKK